jgi:spore germination cell wall hydrolase CwlJ-like protein
MDRLIKVVAVFGVMGLLILIMRIEHKLEVIQAEVTELHQVVRSEKPVLFTSNDIDCLARNIYYEAGVENEKGKYAVGHITMNRLKTGHWGRDICSVVYAKNQFSWTRLKKLPKPDPQKWDESLMIAYDVIKGYRVTGLERSLFYHADYIRDPHWADSAHKITQIGRHIFYTKARNSWLEI